MRPLMEATLEMVFESDRWETGSIGDYCKIPVLNNANQAPGPQSEALRVDGAVLAIYIIKMGIPPADRLHPILLYLLMAQSQAAIDNLMPQDLQLFDPDAAAIFATLDAVAHNQVLDNDHPMVERVRLVLDLPVSGTLLPFHGLLCSVFLQDNFNYFQNPRTREADKKMRSQLLAQLFTGTKDPLNHAGFVALAEGFNIHLDDDAILNVNGEHLGVGSLYLCSQQVCGRFAIFHLAPLLTTLSLYANTVDLLDSWNPLRIWRSARPLVFGH